MLQLRSYSKLVEVNIKIWLKKYLLFSLLLLLFTPIIFYIKNVDKDLAAKICESYFSLSGLIIITSVFSPEEKNSILEAVCSRRMDISVVYIIRIILGSLGSFFIIALGIFILKYLGGNFSLSECLYGSFATTIYLGAIGLIVTSITNETIIGYLASIGYVIMEVCTKGEYTKKLYIYSNTSGSLEEKKYILIAAVIMVISAIVINRILRKLK